MALSPTGLQAGRLADGPAVSSLAQRGPAPRELRLAAAVCALAIVVGTLIAYAFATGIDLQWRRASFVWLTPYLFLTEDAFWLVMIALLLGTFAVTSIPDMRVPALPAVLRRPRIALAFAAGAVLVCGLAGTNAVFHGYHLTPDENLAEFDATILRAGKPIAPVAGEWQRFANALAPRFVLHAANGGGWISLYLPVNALLRALVGRIADPAWTSPLLAALAVLTIFGVAQRLWPDRPDAALVSALLLATSSQVLITAMTSYAMTAHLALNLVWLWFFLRDDKIGHAGAIGVGFLAAGLHQLIFHPLFALPFILGLLEQRGRRLFLIYVFSYAIICLFWMDYWQLVLDWKRLSSPIPTGSGFAYFGLRVLSTVANFDWTSAIVMLMNILRLVAWQNPILLPLALIGFWQAHRAEPVARNLAKGVIYALIAMFIILANQGPGWGYRYLHGLLGNLVLLGAYGWIALSRRVTTGEMSTVRTIFAAAAAIAGLILLPVHAKEAHDFVQPYVRAYSAISHTPADLVMVDKSGFLQGEDLIRNDPFLRNSPKVLDLSELSEDDLKYLCAHYTVAVFDRKQGLALGILPNDEQYKAETEKLQRMRAAMTRLSCHGRGYEQPGTAVPTTVKDRSE
ncbi:MAG TPA: hypothetical protein VFW28_03990 [Micropepsaceae bacterium]|nr:hypothetical protein [Micropepsaceae bacterium]